MTKDELEQLIFGMKSKTRLAEAFEHLTEAQRKKLSTHTNDLRLQITREKAKKNASDLVKKQIYKAPSHWQSIGFMNSQFAVYAMCPLSTIKTRGSGWINNGSKHVFKIISDRNPDWLNDWIEFELDNESGLLDFKMIHTWLQQGMCEKPRSIGYAVKFSEYMQGDNREHDSDQYLTLSQRILQDETLIEDIWPLFQVEHDGFNANYISSCNYQFPKPESIETWTDAIVILTDKGVLNRPKLLNEIIEGLHHDIKQTQLSGMHKLHDLLKPTLDELVKRQDALMAHLSNKVGHVVKFALKHLSKIEKAKKLNTVRFLKEVPMVFQQTMKGNSIQALKLINKVVSTDSELSGQALLVLVEALQHPDIDVQTLALTQIERLKPYINDDVIEQLMMAVNYINPSLKSNLSLLTGSKEAQSEINEPVNREALFEKFYKLNTSERAELGLQLVDLNQENPGQLEPIKSHVKLYSIREHCSEISPILNLDDLILAISSAIEGVDDADEFERILDGISRLCDQRPDDFAQKVAPLSKRIESGFEIYESLVMFYGGLRLAIKSLIVTWLTGKHEETNSGRFNLEIPALETTIKRIEQIKVRIIAQQPQPLFATPTHVGGWIDPVIWVKRIEQYLQLGYDFDRIDFCHSIMRLMPENKVKALNLSKQLKGELARIVCFVLDDSSNVKLRKQDAKNYDLWLTAARCKKPGENWQAIFEPCGIKYDYPGGMQNAVFKSNIYIKEVDEYRFPKIEMKVYSNQDVTEEVSLKSKVGHISEIFKLNQVIKAAKSLSENKIKRTNFPTMVMYKHEPMVHYWDHQLNTAWVSQWLFSIWPSHQGPMTAKAIEHVACRLDEKSSNMETVFGYFQGLFQSVNPFDTLQHTLLSLGLLTSDKNANFAAIDAFVEGVESCKINELEMVDTLQCLVEAEFVKFNRLADSMNQIHPVSTEHAYSVSLTLQGLMCRVDTKLRNLFKIMEVLLEVQTELKIPLDEEVLTTLKTFKGKNKAAQTAKKLLVLESVDLENENNLKLSIIQRRMTLK